MPKQAKLTKSTKMNTNSFLTRQSKILRRMGRANRKDRCIVQKTRSKIGSYSRRGCNMKSKLQPCQLKPSQNPNSIFPLKDIGKMAELSKLTQYIESYVDSSRPQTQQAASLDAIASLVKNDILTINAFVREMEMYLTTTDNIVRARGILLLAELLARIQFKPLDKTTTHSLAQFFADRLADWKALRGAVIGCLALVRRKASAGRVTKEDAKVIMESFLRNLQVQSLGQHDRKLCLELLDYLLECYSSEISSLDDDLIYGICEAIDKEKDPECLILAFHIVESLARLYPDSPGPLANFASEIFEILACYFPIHFTHQQGEELDVKRDDLSKALMSAFASTPLFEPFAVPLFLEKVSSSLKSAKVDSLKYLSTCSSVYGAERMAKHTGAIWSSIKHALFASVEDPVFQYFSHLQDDLGFSNNEIVTEALTLLQQLVMLNSDLMLNLIIGDSDVNMVFNFILSYGTEYDVPSQDKHKLYAVGRVLHFTARTSVASCNKVFESLFPRLIDAVGFSERNEIDDRLICDHHPSSERVCFGVLYLCIEMLSGCRNLIAGFQDLQLQSVSENDICFGMLHYYSALLADAFVCTLARSTEAGPYHPSTYLLGEGLQILATFPGDQFPITKSTFERILAALMSIITVDFVKTALWKLALNSLVHIGTFVDKLHMSEKAQSYGSIVVEKIVSFLSLDDSKFPLTMILEAATEIGTSGLCHSSKMLQGLEHAVFSSLSDFFVYGNMGSAKIAIQLLDCYTCKVLPWISEKDGCQDIASHFAFNIWSQMGTCMDCDVHLLEKGLLQSTMNAMRLAVRSCSVEQQNILIEKAFTVLSSNTSFQLKESACTPIPSETKDLLIYTTFEMSNKDEWIISIFASLVVTLHPRAYIPNLRAILHLFLGALLKGVIPAAQALGSVINKLDTKHDGPQILDYCTLEEALDIIFNKRLWVYDDGILQSGNVMTNSSNVGLTDLCRVTNDRLLQKHAIIGLSWIGKGLLMRGHEKLKCVTMVLLKCLTPLMDQPCENGNVNSLDMQVMQTAADAFHILMCDSEDCLNRKFHALIRPLYKQRFFSTMMPIFWSLVTKNESSLSRSLMYRALAHIVADTPLSVVMSEANKLIPIILGCMSTLSESTKDVDFLYSLLLVLSGMLTERNGQEAVAENAHMIIKCLIELTVYPHKTLVRETAIQCIVVMSELPHTRIYPMRTQVLQALSKALDDKKRTVRQEAVKCRQAWVSTVSSRSRLT